MSPPKENIPKADIPAIRPWTEKVPESVHGYMEKAANHPRRQTLTAANPILGTLRRKDEVIYSTFNVGSVYRHPAAMAHTLISDTKPGDNSPLVSLHPLVVLNISDYAARHQLRLLPGPVVGAILGQQNGREITLEVGFEVKVKPADQGGYEVDQEWFKERLEQYKAVYKDPQLELVAWFVLSNPDGTRYGPQLYHLPIHQFFQTHFNESILLVAFDASHAKDEPKLAAGKLPIEVYESVMEAASQPNDASGEMDIDGGAGSRQLKFRPLKYEIETGQAERIGMDSVARGPANATAVETGTKGQASSTGTADDKKSSDGDAKKKTLRGKGKASASEEFDPQDKNLAPEIEEMVVTLNAKGNAVNMLSSRVAVLAEYLKSRQAEAKDIGAEGQAFDKEALREIESLVTRSQILEPADEDEFKKQTQEQLTDAAVVNLLAAITKGVHHTKKLGIKMAIMEAGKASSGRGRPNREMVGSSGGGTFFDSVMSSGGGSGGMGAFPSPQV